MCHSLQHTLRQFIFMSAAAHPTALFPSSSSAMLEPSKQAFQHALTNKCKLSDQEPSATEAEAAAAAAQAAAAAAVAAESAESGAIQSSCSA